eukprot:TRINITY_DN103432_c0_g1_i1.p1 TRINITY_DN103432_c0_g1~~TRINITY_DN103432_c0_g1_i1.p1  ORF type:complete len:732 (-),score=93.24 TRINITY_DN103432_c0_g1_i1:11-2206(-)
MALFPKASLQRCRGTKTLSWGLLSIAFCIMQRMHLPRGFVRWTSTQSVTKGTLQNRGSSSRPRFVARAASVTTDEPQVRFSHIHMYADTLRPIHDYKKLEKTLNALASATGSGGQSGVDLATVRDHWLSSREKHEEPVVGLKTVDDWQGSGQDVVEQMLVGLGWRVTGVCDSSETKTYALTSSDESGVKVVVTAPLERTLQEIGSDVDADSSGVPHYFQTERLRQFVGSKSGRQGIAVLGFDVSPGGVAAIHRRYEELHPKLIASETVDESSGTKVLEVYAYYTGDVGTSAADEGTLLRFVERPSSDTEHYILPGLTRVDADFDGVSQPAYCDHWVSNVVSRTGFIETLADTLGFSPKVDFNAGVVAAGEAQIESTVTGNTPSGHIDDAKVALKDQSQVYLPINNALSEVGHVHLYLQEIGQGVQHVASRVADLPRLVQRANDMRKVTGAGLSFLPIPRSYYGTLTAARFSKGTGISADAAGRYIAALREAGIVDASDTVALETSREEVLQAMRAAEAEVSTVDLDVIVEYVLRARYGNLYALAGNHISEATYLSIVRNNILLDVQGEDVLMQIFTSTILQRRPGEEAPFLEFIQRACSECSDPASGRPKTIKPGCGGFGIRNFLTLFLSIEVSKASKARSDAEAAGDLEMAQHYGKVVDMFTEQMDESNPILTAISDAMTAEAEATDSADIDAYRRQKVLGQEGLQAVSDKYRKLMAELRLNAPVREAVA